MRPILAALAPLLLGTFVPDAIAFEFRLRWVERVGNIDMPLGADGATIDVSSGEPRRIRLQFGVFDDGAGAAPEGGFFGWTNGTLEVSGPENNSDERRTPGRLSPFVTPLAETVWPPPGAPTDPFTRVADIDAALGVQSPYWGCEGGVPLPMPAPAIRGRNTFVSVYEFTLDPRPGAASYSITAAGDLAGAAEWRVVGSPVPPDCSDPGGPVPGSVQYAAVPTDAVAFSAVLNLAAPAPGAVSVLALSFILSGRRRRD